MSFFIRVCVCLVGVAMLNGVERPSQEDRWKTLKKHSVFNVSIYSSHITQKRGKKKKKTTLIAELFQAFRLQGEVAMAL